MRRLPLLLTLLAGPAVGQIDFEVEAHDYLVYQDGVEQAEVVTLTEAQTLAGQLKTACPSCAVTYHEPGTLVVAVQNTPPPPPPPPPPPTGSDLASAAAALANGESAAFAMGGLDAALVTAGGPHSVLEFASKGYWNPVLNTVEFIGQGHTGSRKHLRWDDATNQWSIVSENSPLVWVGHGYEHSAVNTITGEVYARSGTQIANAETGGTLCNISDFDSVAGAIEYFPEANAVVWLDFNADNLWWCNPGAQRLNLGTFTGETYAFATAITNQVLVGERGGAAWALLSDGSAQAITPPPVSVGPTYGVMLQDPTNPAAALVIGEGGNAPVYRYDGTWSEIDRVGLWTDEHRFAVSIPAYGVVLIIQGRTDPQAVIYKP